MLIFNHYKVVSVFMFCMFSFLVLTSCASKASNNQLLNEITKTNENLNEQLLEVAKDGNFSQLKTLIKQGADINFENDEDLTALVLSSGYGHLEIVKYLVDNGGDANIQNKSGNTALMTASMRGHLEIVKSLVENGADVGAKDKAGYTSLRYASITGNAEIADYLKKHGAK